MTSQKINKIYYNNSVIGKSYKDGVVRSVEVRGFDPRTIAGLEAWWDAADAASVTLNSGNVSQINDKSGNGWHATQATAANQPAYSLAARNGLNVITGANGKRLVTTGPAITTGNTWFLVSTPSTSAGYVLSANDVANSGPAIVSGFGEAFEFFHSFDDLIVISITYSGLAVISSSFVESGPIVNRLNGSQASSKETKATSHAGLTFVRIGAEPQNISHFVGDLCEVILYGRELSVPEKQVVERYLGAKWGVAVA